MSSGARGLAKRQRTTFLVVAADPAGLLPAHRRMAFAPGWHIILASFGFMVVPMAVAGSWVDPSVRRVLMDRDRRPC